MVVEDGYYIGRVVVARVVAKDGCEKWLSTKQSIIQAFQNSAVFFHSNHVTHQTHIPAFIFFRFRSLMQQPAAALTSLRLQKIQ